MARRADTLLGNDKAFAIGTKAPMVNVVGAGTEGLSPNLKNYISNSSYVSNDWICVVLQTPRGFNDLPNPEWWHATLKELMEVGSKNFSGISRTLTVENTENPVGGAGEVQQDVADVKRARSEPVHVFNEKPGKVINRFFEMWIRMLIKDPDTKVPAVTEFLEGQDTPDFLSDYTSMSCLYFEPDISHTKVVDAVIVANMRPLTGGDIAGQRDRTTAGEMLDHSIGFTALQQVGDGVLDFAQQILDEMNLTGVNANRRNAFIDSIDAEVKKGTGGYKETIAEMANDSVESA